MKKETGGHAFPAMNDNGYWVGGMTLRDYFAAKAMQALTVETLKATNLNAQILASNAYAVANAMLKAREQ